MDVNKCHYHMSWLFFFFYPQGQTKKFASGSSPVDFLHDAAVNISCAIKQNPKDPKLHYELGLVLEEQYCAKDLFGIAKEVISTDGVLFFTSNE